MSAIKPCPYCHDDCGPWVDTWCVNSLPVYQITCTNCFAKGPSVDDKAEAIEAHNRLSDLAHARVQLVHDRTMSEKPTVCEHGSLKRQCLTCELQEEIAALRAEVELWEHRCKRAIDVLDGALGDTDPDEIDYHEHPEIYAMHILLGVDVSV